MLVIRLARTGRNKYPTYRIVAAESARAATGKFVSVLGNYNPHTKELVLKKEEILGYIKNGAQPSNTVVKLLQREKLELPAWVVLKSKNKVSKQEPKEEATPTPVAQEEAPAVDKAPTEETPITEEVAAEAETPAEAVAEAATEAEEAASDNKVSADQVETVATEEAAADKAEAGEAAAAEAALAEAPAAE